MGLFNKNKNAFMDVIRCDEKDYLIWKWRPDTNDPNSRSNAIRWGSTLRVMEGAVAAFVYNQSPGSDYDYIEGPCDKPIDTENLPILASIIGAAYNGASPFQAEVYFINLAGIIQIRFAVPYFDVADSDSIGLTVPVAIRGALNFKIDDYRGFVRLWTLSDFNLEELRQKIGDDIAEVIKSLVKRAPKKYGVPLIQIEDRIAEISQDLEEAITEDYKDRYKIAITKVSISAIELDKEHPNYKKLFAKTQNVMTNIATKITGLRQNIASMKASTGNVVNTIKEDNSFAENTERGFFGKKIAGKLNKPTEEEVSASAVAPPPIPVTSYYVAQGSQQTGPFNLDELEQMVIEGKLTGNTLVWKEGMENWQKAREVADLADMV